MRRSRRTVGFLIASVVALTTAPPPDVATRVSIDGLSAAQNDLVSSETGAGSGAGAGTDQAQNQDSQTAAYRVGASASTSLNSLNLVVQATTAASEAVTTTSHDVDTLGMEFVDTLVRRVPRTPSHQYNPNVAGRALSFALAQIGKPYTWGATGPRSFDCSGLAMRAYEAAGVRLPHVAAFQYAASRPLARSQIKPGDLLFWARNPRRPATIYHEALYLGGGRMVQAPKTHRRISVASMWTLGPIQFYARPY